MWNHNNHAYRSNLSKVSAIMQLTDTIYEVVDLNKIAMVMATDETAAFNCVNHNISMKKLSRYNFSKKTLVWIESYLSYRSQYTYTRRYMGL